MDDDVIIEPDYQQLCSDIFHTIAIKLIEQTKDLRILSATDSASENYCDTSLPSWVLQWGNIHRVPQGAYRHSRNDNEADAGFLADYQFAKAANIVRVHGFVIDYVEECTEIFHSEY